MIKSILFKNGMIVTMDKENSIIPNGAVCVEGHKILDVGPSEELEKKYKNDEVIDLDGRILMPGIISNHCHTHGQMTNGMPSYPVSGTRWIDGLIESWWPKLEDSLTIEDVYVVAKYTCMNMLKNGYTYNWDVMEAPAALPGVLDSEAKAYQELGIRGTIVQESTERISEENGELGLIENLDFALKWNDKPDQMLRGALAAHTVYSCSDVFLKRMRELATDNNVPINMHVEESPFEKEYTQRHFKKGSIAYLEDLGVLGPDFLAAQLVQCLPEEVPILAKHGVKVSHNVQTNLEGGCGVAPIVQSMKLGVNVGMGNDGFFLDPFETMRTVWMAHRGWHRDITVLDSRKVLAMATSENAKTVFLEDKIGSIESGKFADLIILNLKSPTPIHKDNVQDIILTCGNGRDIDLTMVHGKIIVRDQKVLSADENQVNKKHIETAQEIWDRGWETPLPKYTLFRGG
ncbi:MAG: amidohydrolase family protein [Candidatus Ranarchaeia archaeon]